MKELEDILKQIYLGDYDDLHALQNIRHDLLVWKDKAVEEARIALVDDVERFKQDILESREIKNATWIGKNELQEWIDEQRARWLPNE